MATPWREPADAPFYAVILGNAKYRTDSLRKVTPYIPGKLLFARGNREPLPIIAAFGAHAVADFGCTTVIAFHDIRACQRMV
jgi:hypothetical protein